MRAENYSSVVTKVLFHGHAATLSVYRGILESFQNHGFTLAVLAAITGFAVIAYYIQMSTYSACLFVC